MTREVFEIDYTLKSNSTRENFTQKLTPHYELKLILRGVKNTQKISSHN